CGDALAWLGKQLEDGRRDDSERAFGAEKELLHVIAGVVFAQTAQSIPYSAVRQHHLEAQHEFAGVAIAQNCDAARVGRKIAADLATALGREAQGQQPVSLARRLLYRARMQPASTVIV